MTDRPDQAELKTSTLQNILHVADKEAAQHIRQYGGDHGAPELEEVSDPYEPSLNSRLAVRAAPSLKELVRNAVANPRNRSPFATKPFDVRDTVTMDASRQTREQIPPDQWRTLVVAAAMQILADQGQHRHQEAIARHIQEAAPRTKQETTP